MADTTAKAKVGRRQWIGLLVLALPGLRALPAAEPQPSEGASSSPELAPAGA